ncbi:choice-of-anchor M domain-containing protein [Actinotignum urinale]|uniref:choice-of-anchor M domain-containing protein n=1 Tax=Actinotignum urinale TaxID=190146 RepID=UPI00280BA570|nr:choice-of-anchor M domain-containing protein [Actinotignum urinale]
MSRKITRRFHTQVRALARTVISGSIVALLVAATLLAVTTSSPLLTATAFADTADAPVSPTENVVSQDTATIEIGAGHVDMGPKFVNGSWELMVRDDTGAQPVWRNIDNVGFKVPDVAKIHVPNDPKYSFIGAPEAWVIPQTEMAGVPWLGWNTQDPQVSQQVNGGVNLVFGGHQGPGQFTLFLQAGNFADPQLLATSTKKTAQSIFVEPNTHTHGNWVFTKPGVHLIKIGAEATLKDGKKVHSSHVLRFAVGGDEELVHKAIQEKWTFTNDPGSATAEQGKGHTSGKGGTADTQSASPSSPENSHALRYVLIGSVVVAVIAVLFIVANSKKRSRIRREELRGEEDTNTAHDSAKDGVHSADAPLVKDSSNDC